jgi:nitrite reductase/ring-hydroxylating ferredoxin subunit
MGFVKVCGRKDVPDGQGRRFILPGREVVVFNCKGRLFANDGTCTHALSGLEEGTVDRVRCTVECPLHGAEFDLATGEALIPPAVLAIKVYPTRLEGDDVLVDVPE